jgi:hypothetical protein
MGESGQEKAEGATGRTLKFGERITLLSLCVAGDSPAGIRDAAMNWLWEIHGHRSENAFARLAPV